MRPISLHALTLLLVLPMSEGAPVSPVLVPGEAVERALAGGQAQTFSLNVKPGQHLLITVEQKGIDLALSVQDPAGSSLGRMDAAEGRHGFERWLLSATDAGTFRIEVRSGLTVAPSGSYRIEARELEAGNPEIEAERLTTEGDLLSSQEAAEPRRQSLERYRGALERWRELGSKPDEARTLVRLAVAHQELDETPPMLQRLKEALSLFSALEDRQGEADTLNYLGLAQMDLGEHQDAILLFERALQIQQNLQDRHGEAGSSQNICLMRLYLAQWREAIPCYEKVLPLLKQVGETTAEAFNGLGGAYRHLGEPRKARENYQLALDQFHALGDRAREAAVLNNLAELSAYQGDLGEALALYGQALEVCRQLEDREWLGRVLNNLGLVYLLLGEPGRALDYLEEALPIRRELGNPRGKVATLDNLGIAHEQLGELDEALKAYGEALEIAQEAGHRTGEAASLNLLAQGKLKAGDPQVALEFFARAAAIQKELGNRGGLAFVLQRTGEAQASLGQREKALATLQESLELNRVLENRSGQAGSLAALAAVERELGRLKEASSHAEEAIGYVELVRATIGEPNLRASFLASQQLAFELATDLRMQLDHGEPGNGHAEAALALSERAHARSLLDLLYVAGAQIRQGVALELRERREDLAYRFSVNAQEQLTASPDQRARLQSELTELLGEADRLEAEIRRRDPRYASFIEPLDSAGIRGLLDQDTLLLEYRLGEKRSFLWLATAKRVDGFELPGRIEIEGLARQAYDALHHLADGKENEPLRALSRVLLAPVADRLPGKRLVIVADGALQYVPFAALPDPQDPAGNLPLVVNHEIVASPSASVLAMQRRLLADRPRAEKTVAVFADPVFTSWDSRLRRTSAGKPSAAAPRALSPPAASARRLQRLVASGREAEAIAALLPPDQVLMALGLQASRSNVLSTNLAPYRIVHFATHGWIDSATPRLSALVFSMFDEKGQEQEGFLGLSDIYNLELAADLVVLSGCETALGRDIRGEGLVGLTQGFLYAGAERVMASAWRVEDKATAELMSRFYGAMLKGNQSPAAALRLAQLAIRSNPEWQDPFFWAPFVLQGDWR